MVKFSLWITAQFPLVFVLFCFFGFVLQVIMFNVVVQWNSYGELVSVVEQNPCCLIDNLYGECESRFLEMISTVVSREQEDED
jgi:hypothetical protein